MGKTWDSLTGPLASWHDSFINQRQLFFNLLPRLLLLLLSIVVDKSVMNGRTLESLESSATVFARTHAQRSRTPQWGKTSLNKKNACTAGRQGPRWIYFVSQIPALTAFDGAGARYENQRRSDEELFPVFARTMIKQQTNIWYMRGGYSLI